CRVADTEIGMRCARRRSKGERGEQSSEKSRASRYCGRKQLQAHLPSIPLALDMFQQCRAPLSTRPAANQTASVMPDRFVSTIAQTFVLLGHKIGQSAALPAAGKWWKSTGWKPRKPE